MDLSNLHNFSKEDPVVFMPLALYCAKCDVRLNKGQKARKYDNATYYHLTCPDIPIARHSTSTRLFKEHKDSTGRVYVKR